MTATAEDFDIVAYYRGLWPDDPDEARAAKHSPTYRRIITRNDPLAFALIYLRPHLKDDATGGMVSMSDAHLQWVERAKEWITPPTKPEESRHAEIAPRSTGKSTWWFLLLPMWGAAHGHCKYIAAFANTAGQAELHLSTFKTELETNELLRADYPELVNPKVRGRGVLASDNRGLYLASSGFAFMARGIDSSTLGSKIGAQRPDVLLLDDIEPEEASYSLEQMEKRKTTITDGVLPLSIMARVVMVGTVTMYGSLMHQLVKSAAGDPMEGGEWIDTEHIVAHHYLPIVTNDDGEERSIWPAKWSLPYLVARRHERSYKKNFENDPMGADGDYWTADTFVTGALDAVTKRLLSIDPAVTSKKSSDFTGLAVVGFEPSTRRCEVTMATAVKLSPGFLRARILTELAKDPEIGAILVETNQGGDVWKTILHDMPVPILVVHQTEKKEVRAARALTYYERGRVIHNVTHEGGARSLAALEGQMVGFPGGPNDDLVDAVGSAVDRFLKPRKKKAAGSVSESYL